MPELDWTAIIVALIGLAGTVVGAGQLLVRQRRKKHTTEEPVEEATAVPASLGAAVHSVEHLQFAQRALDQAQKAMDQAMEVSGKLQVAEQRLSEVEYEVGILRRSYHSLYRWAQRVHREWDIIRKLSDPPNLPDDIQHPED